MNEICCSNLLKKIRIWLVLFTIGLFLSGITAFPLEHELSLLDRWINSPAEVHSEWIRKVAGALQETNQVYPFLAYGTDWLAFAHIVFAIAFIGPIKDPVKNIWVIEFGMISCLLIFPTALICGYIRGIPIYWQLIDCSFGLFGILPLAISRRYTLILQNIQQHNP